MPTIEELRRKRDQAWELAGLARQDGDVADEKRWTDEARRLADLVVLHQNKMLRIE